MSSNLWSIGDRRKLYSLIHYSVALRKGVEIGVLTCLDPIKIVHRPFHEFFGLWAHIKLAGLNFKIIFT